jgi:protein-S-isoprenylcysteine O-methyltransferase Ste14
MTLKSKWIDLLYHVATGSRRIRNLFTPLGAIFFGFILFVFIFTPLFIYANYWELKAIEEPELVKRLGAEYVAYRKKTPMFFPGFNGSKYKEKKP